MLISVAVGVTLVTVAAVAVLWFNRGSRLILDVQIQKVRTQALEEQASAMVIDFRVFNPADYLYQVRKVDVTLDIGGKTAEGIVIADVDAKRLMEYYPALSPKYNDTLRMREKLKPRQSLDRMVAVRFELPESMVNSRRSLTLRIEEVDGPVPTVIVHPPAGAR
ncbi:MAG TPA: hypothetical protein VM120_06470 [Bryobacteraceae bacterium]|nr:hypothetical protein [Bryobacteraceae bacterium]